MARKAISELSSTAVHTDELGIRASTISSVGIATRFTAPTTSMVRRRPQRSLSSPASVAPTTDNTLAESSTQPRSVVGILVTTPR